MPSSWRWSGRGIQLRADDYVVPVVDRLFGFAHYYSKVTGAKVIAALVWLICSSPLTHLTSLQSVHPVEADA